ncbi:hypothetical protein CHUAL_007472 [Chamberlinius hualienensis]
MKLNLLLFVTFLALQVDGFPWSETTADSHGSRIKRGVDLTTIRRLMNNIALSEYYRLRGLEVLGTIGGNRPGGIAMANDEGSASSKSKTIFDFPTRNKEFQQFFGSLGARRNALRG